MKIAVQAKSGKLVSGDDVPGGSHLKGIYHCPKCLRPVYHRARHFQHYHYNKHCPDSMKGGEARRDPRGMWQSLPVEINAWLLDIKARRRDEGLTLEQAVTEYPPPGEYWRLPWDTGPFAEIVESFGERDDRIHDTTALAVLHRPQEDETTAVLLAVKNGVIAFEHERLLLPVDLTHLPDMQFSNREIQRKAWFRRLLREDFLIAVRDDSFIEPVYVCSDFASPGDEILFLASDEVMAGETERLRIYADGGEVRMVTSVNAESPGNPCIASGWEAVRLTLAHDAPVMPAWVIRKTLSVEGGLRIGRDVYMSGTDLRVTHLSGMAVEWFGFYESERFRPKTDGDNACSPDNFIRPGRYYIWADDDRGGIGFEVRKPAETPTFCERSPREWLWGRGWPLPGEVDDTIPCSRMFGAWFSCPAAGAITNINQAAGRESPVFMALKAFTNSLSAAPANRYAGTALPRHIAAVLLEHGRGKLHERR